MRRSLAALCLAALFAFSATRAHADGIVDFAFYYYDDVPFDPFTVNRPLPPDLAPFLTFSLPASPGHFTLIDDPRIGPFYQGLTLPGIPVIFKGTPDTADIYFGDYPSSIITVMSSASPTRYFVDGYGGPDYTISDDLLFTILPTEAYPNPYGEVLLGPQYRAVIGQGGPVAILSVTPEPDSPSSPVPEPSTITLLATGSLGILAAARRRIAARLAA